MPPAKRPTRIKLADLSEEDRAQLLAEATGTEVDEAATVAAAARQAAIAGLMHDRDHLRDCPGGTVEAYESRRPPQPQKTLPAVDVTVVRCRQCGGSTVLEQPYAVTLAAIDQATAEIIETEED